MELYEVTFMDGSTMLAHYDESTGEYKSEDGYALDENQILYVKEIK